MSPNSEAPLGRAARLIKAAWPVEVRVEISVKHLAWAEMLKCCFEDGVVTLRDGMSESSCRLDETQYHEVSAGNGYVR